MTAQGVRKWGFFRTISAEGLREMHDCPPGEPMTTAILPDERAPEEARRRREAYRRDRDALIRRDQRRREEEERKRYDLLRDQWHGIEVATSGRRDVVGKVARAAVVFHSPTSNRYCSGCSATAASYNDCSEDLGMISWPCTAAMDMIEAAVKA